ncbi:hypothetical protein ACFYOF_16595 [Streptomyces sp. NPDC007148]|uniref:hypothetical protein n=1 Tax=Streptomyces sp. NPDC007148 TaxID=3364775 RepID=UPI0036BF389E
MISVLDLRRHIIAAANELNLPLTRVQVDRLATHVMDRAARGTVPRAEISQSLHLVLVGLAGGEEIVETASRIGRAVETVKTQRRRLYARLGAKNGAHAVAIAMDRGLLPHGTDMRP